MSMHIEYPYLHLVCQEKITPVNCLCVDLGQELVENAVTK